MRILLFLLILMCAALPARAAGFDYGAFSGVPVLHEGRFKPLDSFARIYLRRFSGAERVAGLSADAWLAEVLFDPAAAAERAIFFVPSKALKAQMGLAEDQKFFSYAALQAGLAQTAEQVGALLQVDPKSLTREQHALLALHENAASFTQLMRSFSLLLPLDIALPETYGAAADESTYVGLFGAQTALKDRLKEIVRRKGEDIDTYSREEKALTQAMFRFDLVRYGGEGNALLRVIPGAEGEMVSPWVFVLDGQGTPEGKARLDLWAQAAQAYRAGDAGAFARVAQVLGDGAPFKIKAEQIYNALHPFHMALVLYALSVLGVVFAAFRPQAIFERLALGLLGLGVAAHMLGVAARVFLLARPPVGTLYESIIFVALVCAALSLVLALKTGSRVFVFCGALMGAGLLALAPALIAQGESMEMLVAVLNTNFWLSTHVLCITAGYGLSILAACLAHGWLALKAAGRRKALPGLMKGMYRMAVAALLLTAVGTALGGIWADQSWGRFWGWDPKENGALLIVLWLVWALHGRAGGVLGNAGFAALVAGLNVIVALAWFGVNLLSVGLHSYGFTEGAGIGLALFIALEAALIGGLYAKEKFYAA